MNQKDNIFAELKGAIEPFRFDQKVVEVFEDMIKRSVPGYEVLVQLVALLAKQVVTPASHIYDLGSSLGAVTLAIRRQLDNSDRFANCCIHAIDNSTAMVEKSKLLINAYQSKIDVVVEENDINDVAISNASMVILNFTLQFIPVAMRGVLLERIYDGLNPGGVLVLSEKVSFLDNRVDDLVINLHEDFKRIQGYSELEISQKREALQNVMVPESLEQHRTRLTKAGFSHIDTWFQQYNFTSMIAIK